MNRLDRNRLWSRMFVLSFVLLLCQGCTYLRHRVDDALEMADFGVTYSKKPYLGLYWNSLEVFPVGYSKVDGYFVGWGGGQLGVTRHYNECYGFGYARETTAWGDFDLNDPSTYDSRDAGVIGILAPPWRSGPAYTPGCVHFFPHLGYVGLVWNARYAEMADFVLGWVLLDVAGDDGYKIGRWSFPRRRDDTQ